MKRRIKLTLLRIAKRAGIFSLARFLTRRSFVIVGWHGVSHADEHEQMGEYFISRAQLAERLKFLGAHYEIVPLSKALEQHRKGKLEARQVVLTFDDGLANFGTCAVPELERASATATLYAVSARMDEPLGRYFPVQHLLLLADDAAIARSESARGASGDGDLRRRARDHHAEAMLPLDPEGRREYLRVLAKELDVDFNGVLDSRTWEHHTREEVRALSARGFDVQVHTHDHKPVTEDPGDAERQAAECRRLLEDATGVAARDYCYPSGLWTREAWGALEAAGMRSATTCRLGPNFVGTPALALRRYIDHSEISQLEFEALVSGVPWLVHLLFHPARLTTPSEAPSPDTSLY